MTRLIVCATASEADPLIRRMGLKRVPDWTSPGTRYQSTAQSDVELLITGIGKTNSALALSAFIYTVRRPLLVVNTGIAGSYPQHGAVVGQVAVAVSETYADEGVLTSDGYRTLDDIGFPIISSTTTQKSGCPLPEGWDIADTLRTRTGLPVLAGPFITVSTCAGSSELVQMRDARFHPLCESMEGAAVCHTCKAHDIPFVEIRGISNLVGHYDKTRWDIPAALDHVTICVQTYLEF